MQIRFHRLRDFKTQSGAMLTDGFIAFATAGTLNAARDNVVVLPSYYSGTHLSYAGMIGPGRALDPAHWFVVLPNMFGNGQSSSPSNHAAFPAVSIADNVAAQHDLLVRGLGVSRIKLTAGWSLGAMQALHWAMLFPDLVMNAVAICGTAFCWPVNTVFLSGLEPILQAAVPERDALNMFGRAYCGWAYSAAFFRDELYRQLGFASIDALLDYWAADHATHRAADLLAVLQTWRAAQPRIGDLAAITAKCVIMPGTTDAYFTVADAAAEAARIANAQLAPIESPYGHCAGAPARFLNETAQIEDVLRLVLGT